MSNYTFFFIIEREHKAGHKEVDHILPFFYLLKEKGDISFTARGIIYGVKSIVTDRSDPRIELLSGFENVEIIDPYNTDNILIKFIRNLNKKINGRITSRIFRVFTLLLLKLYRNADKKINWEKAVGREFIDSRRPVILSLNLSEKIKKMVLEIKRLNPAAKWVVIPHGTIISDNRMLWFSDLSKDDNIELNPLYQDVDYYLRTSKRDMTEAIRTGLSEEKGCIIGSPRFCSDWMQKKHELGLDGDGPSVSRDAKVRILFLIPKFFINVFNEELIRTLKFISSYEEIDLILNRSSRDYPKLDRKILKQTNVRDYLISKEFSTGALVSWSDIVMHVGTGVVFEPFMKGKIVVFPRYLTCNTLISEKYNAGWNLKNRDELRDLCNMAVRSLTDTQEEYLRCHESANNR